MKLLQSAIALAVLIFFFQVVNARPVKPADPPVGFHHEYKTVNGIKIHYVIGGKGQPLLLIHGFGQNWYMWNRLLPALSTHFTVIAPDLPGVGESGKPREGYDKKSLSADLHELIKRLGFKNINIAGHDIGMMVAYSYAAQYRSEVKKIALLDAVIPGVDPDWSHLYHTNWWFGFFARPIAGDIVSDHASEFLKDFWSLMAHRKEPFTSRESQEFIRAYSVPGAATGSFHWFGAFLQDAKDNQEFIKTKLTMPMLAVSGEFSAASYFTNHCKQVAGNVTGVIIHGSGHWLVQENTAEVLKAFIAFFGN